MKEVSETAAKKLEEKDRITLTSQQRISELEVLLFARNLSKQCDTISPPPLLNTIGDAQQGMGRDCRKQEASGNSSRTSGGISFSSQGGSFPSLRGAPAQGSRRGLSAGSHSLYDNTSTTVFDCSGLRTGSVEGRRIQEGNPGWLSPAAGCFHSCAADVYPSFFIFHSPQTLQSRLQAAEARNEELAASVPDTTRPLLRQIEHLQALLASKQRAWEDLEHRYTIIIIFPTRPPPPHSISLSPYKLCAALRTG